MGRVTVYIVIPIFVRIELQDKSVADSALGPTVSPPTCQPTGTSSAVPASSVEISLPPDIDTIYGLCVLGCTHVFFKPKDFEVIWWTVSSGKVYLSTWKLVLYLFDGKWACAVFELEQDNVRSIGENRTIWTKEICR